MGRLRTNVEAPQLVKDFKNYKDLKDFKPDDRDIYLEIGCGKGDFLINQAISNPNILFLGIEKYATVTLKALKKIERNKLVLNNLFFTCLDAGELKPENINFKVSKLFLNFSDPWPKKRHAKRRLTSPNFLDLYKTFLSKNAVIEFKTDNDGLYAYTLEVLESRKDIEIIYFTTDLYKELDKEINKNNIQTEYEKKFVNLNKNINKIVFKFKS